MMELSSPDGIDGTERQGARRQTMSKQPFAGPLASAGKKFHPATGVLFCDLCVQLCESIQAKQTIFCPSTGTLARTLLLL
jgi:hypothetical protein